MKILKTGTMKDGTHIQIEEWQENYSFMPYSATIASYPISKYTYEGSFAPKAGERVRFAFNFFSQEETERIFNELIEGKKTLSDIIDYMDNPKYKKCI